MTTPTDTYSVAILSHGLALKNNLVARVACDNAKQPTWWCEAADPVNGGWVRLE